MMRSFHLSVFFLGGLTLAGPLFGDGTSVFEHKCGQCHRLSTGGNNLGKGRAGPDLTGFARKRPLEFLRLYSRAPEAGRKKFPEIYAREIAPKRYKRKMKNIRISDTELDAIIELLK